ncbi:MAG: MMPL family transporter [Myxococcota bacterium]|nr:MMPL family transporter [Myxococcota bacterium]
MIERFLNFVIRLSVTQPLAVLLSGLCLGISFVYVAFLPIDLSFSGVMDRSHPQVSKYFEVSARLGLGGRLLVLLEGPEAELDSVLPEIQLVLDGLDPVESVWLAPSRDYFVQRAPWMVERELFDRWVASADGETPDLDYESLLAQWESAGSRFLPPAPYGARLVTIRMTRDSFELALDAEDFSEIRAAVAEVLSPTNIEARFAGMSAIVQQENEATLSRIRLLGPLSMILVLCILFSIVRRFALLATIALPMLLSVGCTLTLVGLLEGRLTLMESIFGVIVFGLGVDFAIHLLVRLSEERDAGFDFSVALRRAMTGTGRGVVAGGVTTAGAFLLLTLAPEPVFYRLGLAGGVGLALCLLFLLLLLPAQWTLLERVRPGLVRIQRPSKDGLLVWMAGQSAHFPRSVFLIAIAFSLLAGFLLPRVRYETNLERVFSPHIEAVETARRIHELFDLDPGPWVVSAADISEARRLHEAFAQDSTFSRVDSLALIETEDQAERGKILEALAPKLARHLRERSRTTRGQSASTLVGEGGFKGPPEALLLNAHTLGPPQRDSLPPALADRWVGPDGELLIYAFSAAPSMDSIVARQERRAAQAIAPDATSMSIIYEVLVGTDRPWMPAVVLSVLLFVGCVVWADLGKFRLAVIALVPVVASAVWTLGLLNALGFSFNTVSLVAIPVFFGLAVDDGIHVVHRMVELPGTPLRRVVGSVARSVAMTTWTTCASVALLLWTDHPGIESIAILLGVGLPMALLATVTLIPALATLWVGTDSTRQLV